MTKKVVILGAGFGGLELTTLLSEQLGEGVQITLIDQNDSFVFGFSKLDVMFGTKEPDEVRLYYREIVRPNVEFKQEHIESIDPERRIVTTAGGEYEADFLVVALGADYDMAATPGLIEGGNEFYSVEGAERLRKIVPVFDSGLALIAVLGPFFKCPPAPFEAAMMLHEHVRARGAADAVTIRVLTPLSAPIPVSKEASEGILSGLNERGIEFWPQSKVARIEPTDKVAVLDDGRTIEFDLFLGVPRHCAPPVVEASGLTVDGWIPVETTTFTTKFPGVYAIGDVTSAPVPRAGVFAEGEAKTVAAHIVREVRGSGDAPPYGGVASCYVEFGGGEVGRVDVEFLTGPGPKGTFAAPSLAIGEEKVDFARSRAQRWFGRP